MTNVQPEAIKASADTSKPHAPAPVTPSSTPHPAKTEPQAPKPVDAAKK
jgi:hypothetical protein